MSKILIDEAKLLKWISALKNCYDVDVYPSDGSTAQDKAIAEMSQALANEALVKMAENARELGLTYEQPAVKTYCGGKPNYCIPEQPAPAHCEAGPEYCQQCKAEQLAQEPYGYFRYDIQLDAWVQNKEANVGVAFYTEPAKREWVGLTDEERDQIINDPSLLDWWDIVPAIEAKLKEKNTKGGAA